MQGKTIFISGIDTDAGKTIITGALAKKCIESNIKAITQKLTQTGVIGTAEDILMHRKIMDTDLNVYDKWGITCPYVFKMSASPHLAAKFENEIISTEKIKEATELLENYFQLVLLEGAGGLHVPLNDSVNIIDYIQQNNYPLILVTNSKLGSINHTLLSLEIIKRRRINLLGVVYNHFPANNKSIQEDSICIFRKYVYDWFKNVPVVEFPVIESGSDYLFENSKLLIDKIKRYLK